ncbi:hypothetical protein [Photobacterium kishitanii]|uniref:Uncharacterized protein n=1 Tax=Photobacterium kishitanii TaxID=318456 RepID=A0A2T3KN23_9GAMM|nr:hypothetical protein [Photobacterium kishitanii]PSV01145.1 hypothetical protein C9J27_03740 [Photobacterium kishitanii]
MKKYYFIILLIVFSSANADERVFHSGEIVGDDQLFIYRYPSGDDFNMVGVKSSLAPILSSIDKKIAIWNKISECQDFKDSYKDPATFEMVEYDGNPDCSFSILTKHKHVMNCQLSHEKLEGLVSILKADRKELMGFEAVTPYEHILLSKGICKSN